MNSLTDSITDSKKDSYTINSMTGDVVERSFLDTMQESNIIRMTDSDDLYGLQQFCYEKCDKFDSDKVKRSRGIVFSGETLVMEAFPYTEEIRKNDIVNFSSKINLSDSKFYYSYEGMLIRMFFYQDKWFVTTHRKLDAFKSKWSSRVSFGEMFINCLEKEYRTNPEFTNFINEKTSGDSGILDRFKSVLDKTRQYMFLVLNEGENRIVCINDKTGPSVLHVGTFDSTTRKQVDDNVYVRKPTALDNVYSSLEEVYEHSQTVDYTKYQGIIIFTPDNKQYKVLNNEYEYFYSIRGNEPSIKFRYLQIRSNEEYNRILRQMYPEMCSTFDMYENYIRNIAKDIFNAYVERFMKKNFTTVSQDEYVIIKACHGWHLKDRKKNIVSLKRVFEEINNVQPSLINKMIRTRIQKERKLAFQG